MLQTRTFDLRDERDRLDDELDDLADRMVELEDEAAELQGEASGLGDDAAEDDRRNLQTEFGRLMEEREELEQDVERIQQQFAGVEWAVSKYGTDDAQDVATDGGVDERARVSETSDEDPRDEQEPDIEEVRREMAAPDDESAGNEPVEPSKPSNTGGRKPRPSDSPPDGERDEGAKNTGSKTANPTITLGGLDGGEYARVTDKVGDAQQQTMGFGGQGGSVDGASQIFYCAMGLVDAPFIERGAGFEQKVKAVRGVSPSLLGWMQEKIGELTTPSESAGNDFSARLNQARARRNGTSQPE